MSIYSQTGSGRKVVSQKLPASLAWSVLDDLDEGIVVAEIGGAIRYTNRAAKELLGRLRGDGTLPSLMHALGVQETWLTAEGELKERQLVLTNGRLLDIAASAFHGNGDLVKIVISPSQTAPIEMVEDASGEARQLALLVDANAAISTLLEEQAVLQEMGDRLLRTGEASAYAIYEWERDSDSLVVKLVRTEEGQIENLVPGLERPLPISSIARQALSSGETLVLDRSQYSSAPIYEHPWQTKLGSHTHVIIPMVMSDDTYGLVELLVAGHSAVESSRLELLVALTKQASIALENALLFEDLYERERFYNALGRVSLALNYTLAREKVLDLIASESLRIFGVDGAYIWQLEEDRFVGQAAAGQDEDAFLNSVVSKADEEAFVTSLAKGGATSYINNLDEQARSRLKLPDHESILAVLGVPIEQEGEIAGVLVLVDKTRPFRFGNKDANQAGVFASQVAIAMRNARLFAELRTLNEELDSRVAERTRELNEESNRVKILLRITSELSASLDHERVLNQALQLVTEEVDATEGVIMLINPETDDLEFRSVLDSDDSPRRQGVSSGLKRDKGLAGWMIEQRSAVIVADTRKDPRWIELPRSRAHRSVLGVPLISDEEVIGVMMLFHNRTSAFTSQQLDLVEAAAIQVANAISNANLYLLIRDQAESLGSMLLTEQIEAAKNQSILESIADGVLVADGESKIVIANRAAGFILDVTSESLIGRSINELLGVYGQAGEGWMNVIGDWAANADLIEQGVFLADELTIEDKVISVHLSPVLAGNQFFGTVSIFRDITKNVEVDRLKGEFVSTVSHELRTPMTSIKGYTDLILMGAAGDMSDAQRRYMHVIRNNAERLHMLVNDLLDISRIETAKTVLKLRPTDLASLIEEVVDGHVRGRIQHENRNILISVETEPGLPLVNADPDRVTQILTNLLDNAINYSPEDGEISVRARASGSFVSVSVSDTGIGIAEEIQPKIFERFFRSEEPLVQKVPGTGLGLTIVSNLIAMHGGQLRVQSAPSQGSTFSFTLPVVLEDSEPP